ncbi:MAG: sigma-70 family RNA polymerase sigma factor [Candidatus Hydrogenedentes bacterium]|nr:sigma-70 family RNA polymerase sigma factor [Candidatus Hydrogenedentota bacterium]
MAQESDTYGLEERARLGDSEAFGQLAETHYRAVYGIAFSSVGNWSGAQDIAQETFLLAWSRRATLRNAAAFPAWVRRISTNLSKNWIRSADYRRRLANQYSALTSSEAAPDCAPDAEASAKFRKAEVWRALETLSPPLRQVVVLYYLQGESLRSVADALGISENAAKKRLHHARAKLRAHFEEQWQQEMAQARFAMGTHSVRDRFLAGIVLGPALPELGKSVASTGLGLWWETTKQTAMSKPFWAGVGAMTLKQVSVSCAIAVAIVGALYWGLYKPVEEIAPTQVVATTPVAHGEDAKLTATQSHDVVGQRVAMPAAPVAPVVPAAIPEVLPIKIADPKDYITLQGSVVDANNVPVAGAEVSIAALGVPHAAKGASDEVLSAHREAYRKYTGKREHYWNGMTDEAGQFVVKEIRFAGTTVITARAPGYASAMKYIALDEANTSRENITLQLLPGMTVYGKLLSASGQPITDGVVRLVSSADADGGVANNRVTGLIALTDDSGGFELDIEAPGTLSLGAQSELYGVATFSDVVANSDEVIELRYPQQSGVFGVVRNDDGSVVRDVQVQLDGHIRTSGVGPVAIGKTLNATTDASGAYRIANVDPGQRYSTKVIGANGVPLADGEPIEQLVAGTDYELNFTVKPQMTVRGTVYGTHSGKPLKGISVAAIPENEQASRAGGPIERVVSEASGPEGEYSLTLSGDGGTYTLTASYSETSFIDAGVDLSDRPSVTLEPGKTVTQDIGVVEPATRSFVLVDESGNPVANAATAVEVKGRFNMAHSTSVGTDAEGHLTMPGLPSSKPISVIFSKSGYLRAQSAVATSKPGETLPEEVVVMYKATAARALIINSDGTALTNEPVEVRITYGENEITKDGISTDADGYVLIPSELPATEVTIQISVSRYRDGSSSTLRSVTQTYSLAADTQNDLGQVTVAPVTN